VGVQTRTRRCNNPPPDGGGRPCGYVEDSEMWDFSFIQKNANFEFEFLKKCLHLFREQN